MKILDCTLRDGGYCNNWKFGHDNIKMITERLVDANIEIIECGFITNRVCSTIDISKYNTVEQVKEILPKDKGNSQFVCMINYGEYDIDNLQQNVDFIIDGIRLAFHKKDIDSAMNMAKIIKAKGYKVFLQPMVSLNYTDEEFLDLIKKSNELEPYAFYIVDSFGVMKRRDLIRLFYLVEHNLNGSILIGFHSHNNMQLAYSNAQALLGAGSRHELIIDTSIFGMGRGAGNLNTELFVEYLNDYYQKSYDLKPLLTIIDEILNPFYQDSFWGYSLPNYLSAKYNTHPNYAAYLNSRNTLTIDNMDDIFSLMEDEKRVSYDETYIEGLYIKYLSSGDSLEFNLSTLREKINRKRVVIIAPGRSSISEKDKILNVLTESDIKISVNFDYHEFDTDYIFLSNLRRFRNIPEDKLKKCIVTSNVPTLDAYVKTDYKSLLNDNETVMDNASMMLIKFLIDLGCEEILLAGLDGYSYDAAENFVQSNMQIGLTRDWVEKSNKGMSEMLGEYSKQISIKFLTEPKFVCIENKFD